MEVVMELINLPFEVVEIVLWSGISSNRAEYAKFLTMPCSHLSIIISYQCTNTIPVAVLLRTFYCPRRHSPAIPGAFQKRPSGPHLGWRFFCYNIFVPGCLSVVSTLLYLCIRIRVHLDIRFPPRGSKW